MAASELISVVIPAYNPLPVIEETILSVQRQTHPSWEIIIVDDGSNEPESIARLEALESRRLPGISFLREGRLGLPRARNFGMARAKGRYLVPLDSDDTIEPQMMEVCLEEIEKHPEAGFVYSDYRVFGRKNYIEYTPPYNLYRLMHQNFIPPCIFLRREAWEDVRGYDDWHLRAYEDWHFLLHLGERGWYGRHVPQVLFNYRVHRRGHHYIGLAHHDENWAHIVESRQALFSPEGRLNVKLQWSPAICFVVRGGRAPSFENQTIRDYQVLIDVDEKTALEKSNAPYFLWMTKNRPLRPHAAEECVWALQAADWATWTDTGEAPPPSLKNIAGPLGVRREILEQEEPRRSGSVRRIPWPCRDEEAPTRVGQAHPERSKPSQASQRSKAEIGAWTSQSTPLRLFSLGALFDRFRHHLHNAELLSAEAWLKHPLRSVSRLVPLRLKERINEIAGRPVFDLSFYLKFQPRSVLIRGQLFEKVDYIPPLRAGGKRRIALYTPHLGVGGAENVLLEFSGQIDRSQYEVFLIATQSDDSRLRGRWEELADHIYDASKLLPTQQTPQLCNGLAVNWEFDVLVIQNSVPAYSILPALKQERPAVRVIDFLHNVDEDWDFFSATLDVADYLDRRVVISQAGRDRILEMNIEEEKIHLIRNGVDLDKYDPQRFRPGGLQRALGLEASTKIILFAGALVKRKRPLLLPQVAMELGRLRPQKDYQFVVAGDGPEEERLRIAIRRKGLGGQFTLLGHVAEMPELLAEADLLVILSTEEGIPLVLVESLAMETPAVSCRAGAIEEALPEECGVLVDPGSGEEGRLAQVIDELLEDDQRRREMGKKGRELARRDYSLDRARRQYRELLAEL